MEELFDWLSANRRWQKVLGALAVLILFLFLWPFKIVASSEKGLSFKFGAIQDRVLDNGLHFRIPVVQRIQTVSIQPIQLVSKVEVGAGGAITKDNQTIGAEMSVFYKYDPSRLVEMWSKYGEDKIQNIVNTTLRESFKEEIGMYDIFLLPVKQDEIRSHVYDKVKARMANYPIEITELKIVNYDWSEQFDQQIQNTMERAQQVKQAEQELLITEQEAQKKVKEAEADKEATVKKAEADRDAAKLQAEAKALEGAGIRQYNEEIAKNLDIELRLRTLEIERLKWDKWNGAQVPEQVFSPIPFSSGFTNK